MGEGQKTDRQDDVSTGSDDRRGSESRRSHDRTAVSLWAVETSRDAAYYHYISELSEGGLYLEKPLPLPVDSEVELEVELPGGIVKARGVVVRRSDDGTGHGVKFKDISPDALQALRSFLAASH